MKTKMNFIARIGYFTLTILFTVGCSEDDFASAEPKPIQIVAAAKGSSLAQIKTLVHPETAESFEAACFLLDLIDPGTESIIGSLKYYTVENIIPGDGTIISSVITIINLQGKGSIVAENDVLQTIIPPVLEFNFLTEATPSQNNVIDATLDFENMGGSVSISGKSNFAELGDGIAHFDYLFTIDLVSN